MPTENATPVTTLTNKIARLKIVARDMLRAKLINPRLSKINELEANIKNLNAYKADLKLDLDTEIYEISKLDVDHPKYDKTKAKKEEYVKSLSEVIAEKDKENVEIEKMIAEQKEKIQKIETGETKVSLEDLNDLVDTLLRQDALNQVAE